MNIPSLTPARKALEQLKPYSGEMPESKLILAANESSYNLPKALREEIAAGVVDFPYNRYPDPLGQSLRKKIAEAQAVPVESVLIGNGGDELLLDIVLAWGGAGRTMLQFTPTFSMYRIYAEMLETEVISIPRNADDYAIGQDGVKRLAEGDIDLCFLDNPNNPSGQLLSQEEMCTLIEASNALCVVDEAYFEFSGQSMLSYLENYPNMVILRTFSKAYSLAGLRLGYVLAHPEVIDMLARVRMPYSVNAFSQCAGELVVGNLAEFDQPISDIIRERSWLFDALQDTPNLKVWPSKANYLLFRLEGAGAIWQRLLDKHDIYIRDFSSASGLEECLRVTVGTREENQRFVAALRESIAHLSKEGG